MKVRALALSLAALGCSYDLDALRGRDAGPARDVPVDRTMPTDTGIDAGVMDVGTDTGRPTDRGPRTDVMMAMCSTATNLPTDPLGGILLEGSTMTEGMAYPAFGNVGTCTEVTNNMAARAYRYVMRGDGPLVVTTNTGLCNTFDTRVLLARGCDAASLMTPIRCEDDLTSAALTCATCTTGGTDGANTGNCYSQISTATAPLLAGDQVIIFVSGYQALRGNYRVWIGENPAQIERAPNPVVPPSFVATNRCRCTGPVALGSPATITFPDPDAIAPAGPLVPGASSGDQVFQARTLAPAMYVGVSGQFQMNLNAMAVPECFGADAGKVVLDLLIGQTLVTSFSINASVRSGIVTLPFTNFAPTMLGAAGPTNFYLRARSEVGPHCVDVTVARDSKNRVLLYRAAM